MSKAFGEILKKWRKLRRYSQLQLASEVGVSCRHISFLETGRSSPSQATILKLGRFLHMPRREINRALAVSDFAPIYRETLEADADLAPINFAIDKMLKDHMPYPALVLNKEWDMIKANESALTLLKYINFTESNNLIESLLQDDPATSKILNWGETVSVLLDRLRYEIDMLGGSRRMEDMERALRRHLCANGMEKDFDHKQVVLNTKFQVEGDVLSFFSVVSQLGAVMDVTVSEFTVELMFPADETTKNYYAI